MAIKLVVGLGNPGPRYAKTRHNVGYRVIEHLRRAGDCPARLFVVPAEVYMNESGGPVAAVARKNGLTPDQLLVVCDDFAIPLGRLRLRAKGSSGGHNGLDSILEHLGTTEVPRLRVGIGPVPAAMDPADFVLKPFEPSEEKQLDAILSDAADAARAAVCHNLDYAMNRFNLPKEERPEW